MAITQKEFGKTADGKTVTIITLTNKNGMSVSCIDYGANVVSVEVPDGNGKLKDVALGFDSVSQYEVNAPFFGAFIGRHANRIGGASFTLDGKTYGLEKNDGNNNLHSGAQGYHKMMYDYKTAEGEGYASVSFSRTSPDMEQGYPGKLDFTVTYKLTDDNEFCLIYDAVSDKDTIVNFTNHSYFNLDGHDAASIEDHIVRINAKRYTVTTPDLIPTGELADVAGTPLDFSSEKRIGQDIGADFDTLKYGGGYDLNYVIDKPAGEYGLAAAAKGNSGITMEVYTDLPGVQFYTGNNIGAGLQGKNGAVYNPRSGFCFETQFFPNSCNIESFPSCVLEAGKKFHTETVYKFLG
ncbi:MAG: galactose mutarotase [Lachnospiraceae bacterium]|nr:galactose mutarotase [Lachnospiraceae bacterium]